jgi:hypothetical protein
MTPPIIGSREKKMQVLEARKKDLLLRKKHTTDPAELTRIDNLLNDVEELLKKYVQPTTLRRRIRKTDEE